MTLGNHKPRIGWRVPRVRRAVSANSILAGRYDPVVRARYRRGRAPRDRRAGRATRLAGVTHGGQEMSWIVLARYARNRRLGDALQPWDFCRAPRITRSKAYYKQLRARNIGHQSARAANSPTASSASCTAA